MHLIAPLSAGISGAENGRATIYKRGTSVGTTLYQDFEATVPMSASEITLDAYGGAVYYVDEVVDVSVYASDDNGGALIRKFTAGASDNAVEVVSPSFTGTDYVGGASGANKPVILGTALDRLATSFGTDDFDVSLNGTIYTVQNAFLSVWGMFFNVKDPTYGATGDGSTDDTSAINAAFTAAAVNGGVVLFPPGTYRITDSIVMAENTSLWGTGPNSTIITMDHASNTFVTWSGSAGIGDLTVVRGVTFQAEQANTGNVFSVTRYSTIVSECVLGSTSGDGANIQGTLFATGSLVDNLTVRDCQLYLNGGSMAYDGSSAVGFISWVAIENCEIQPAISQGLNHTIDGGNLRIRGCKFDNSATTTGTYSNIVIQNGGNSWVTECDFLRTAGATVKAIEVSDLDASDRFFENNNFFDTFAPTGQEIVPYDISNSIDEQQVHLGTRENNSVSITDDSGGTVSLDSDQFGRIVLQCTTVTTGRTISLASEIPVHSRFMLVLWNDGTGGNVIFTHDATNSETSAATITVANNTLQAVEFVAFAGDGGTVRWHQVNTPIAVAIP